MMGFDVANCWPDAEAGCKVGIGLDELNCRRINISIEGDMDRVPILLTLQPSKGIQQGVDRPPFGQVAKMNKVIFSFA